MYSSVHPAFSTVLDSKLAKINFGINSSFWYGSQVTQMILHDVFIARHTMVFPVTMVFFPCLGCVDHFVTCQAFPPFFAFRSFISFWHYVSGNTFWIDTSCDISDTSVVHPFWDSSTFYTRCRSLHTHVSLYGCSV